MKKIKTITGALPNSAGFPGSNMVDQREYINVGGLKLEAIWVGDWLTEDVFYGAKPSRKK